MFWKSPHWLVYCILSSHGDQTNNKLLSGTCGLFVEPVLCKQLSSIMTIARMINHWIYYNQPGFYLASFPGLPTLERKYVYSWGEPGIFSHLSMRVRLLSTQLLGLRRKRFLEPIVCPCTECQTLQLTCCHFGAWWSWLTVCFVWVSIPGMWSLVARRSLQLLLLGLLWTQLCLLEHSGSDICRGKWCKLESTLHSYVCWWTTLISYATRIEIEFQRLCTANTSSNIQPTKS